MKMGAKDFIMTSDKDWAKPYAQKFDMILSTVDDSAGLSMADLFSMLKLHGRLHSVGLPDAPVPEFQFQAMAGNAAQLSVSHLGNKKQANEMLALAAEKGITCWKQVLPMAQAGEAVRNVKENKVRYRHVLKVDI